MERKMYENLKSGGEIKLNKIYKYLYTITFYDYIEGHPDRLDWFIICCKSNYSYNMFASQLKYSDIVKILLYDYIDYENIPASQIIIYQSNNLFYNNLANFSVYDRIVNENLIREDKRLIRYALGLTNYNLQGNLETCIKLKTATESGSDPTYIWGLNDNTTILERTSMQPSYNKIILNE